MTDCRKEEMEDLWESAAVLDPLPSVDSLISGPRPADPVTWKYEDCPHGGHTLRSTMEEACWQPCSPTEIARCEKLWKSRAHSITFPDGTQVVRWNMTADEVLMVVHDVTRQDIHFVRGQTSIASAKTPAADLKQTGSVGRACESSDASAPDRFEFEACDHVHSFPPWTNPGCWAPCSRSVNELAQIACGNDYAIQEGRYRVCTDPSSWEMVQVNVDTGRKRYLRPAPAWAPPSKSAGGTSSSPLSRSIYSRAALAIGDGSSSSSSYSLASVARVMLPEHPYFIRGKRMEALARMEARTSAAAMTTSLEDRYKSRYWSYSTRHAYEACEHNHPDIEGIDDEECWAPCSPALSELAEKLDHSKDLDTHQLNPSGDYVLRRIGSTPGSIMLQRNRATGRQRFLRRTTAPQVIDLFPMPQSVVGPACDVGALLMGRHQANGGLSKWATDHKVSIEIIDIDMVLDRVPVRDTNVFKFLPETPKMAMWGWHGTHSVDPEVVIKSGGLDPSLCGDGLMLGGGSYLAEGADYCHVKKYAHADRLGNPFLEQEYTLLLCAFAPGRPHWEHHPGSEAAKVRRAAPPGYDTSSAVVDGHRIWALHDRRSVPVFKVRYRLHHMRSLPFYMFRSIRRGTVTKWHTPRALLSWLQQPVPVLTTAAASPGTKVADPPAADEATLLAIRCWADWDLPPQLPVTRRPMLRCTVLAPMMSIDLWMTEIFRRKQSVLRDVHATKEAGGQAVAAGRDSWMVIPVASTAAVMRQQASASADFWKWGRMLLWRQLVSPDLFEGVSVSSMIFNAKSSRCQPPESSWNIRSTTWSTVDPWMTEISRRKQSVLHDDPPSGSDMDALGGFNHERPADQVESVLSEPDLGEVSSPPVHRRTDRKIEMASAAPPMHRSQEDHTARIVLLVGQAVDLGRELDRCRGDAVKTRAAWTGFLTRVETLVREALL
jgi:hypothetical protein